MFRQRLVFLFVFLFAVACQAQQPQPSVSPLSPPPTPLPPPLEAWVYPQTDLDHFWPPASLVIHFNQPVDPRSGGKIILPAGIESAATWDDSHTRLTLTPTGNLTPDTIYSVALSDYVSVRGAGFASPPQWQIRTLDHPRVVDQRPSRRSSDLDRRPMIQLVFDREMNRASVTAALSVAPPVALETQWGTLTLTIQPREPLTPGIWYSFLLTQTATDLYGIPLDGGFCWSYWVSDLIADRTWPRRQGDRSTPLVIRFNYAMDTDSVRQALTIDPAIKGKTTWSGDRTTVTITPDSPLPNETPYIIRFNQPLRDARGDALPAPAPMSFTTPPAILSINPGSALAVHPATAIQVVFDRPMDHAATESAFRIAPTMPGSFEWHETTLTFLPQGSGLDESTTYTITIHSTARDLRGEPVLQQPYTWSFETGASTDVANFGWGPNAQVVDAEGRRAVQFQVAQAGPTPLTFELYRLSVEQFLDRYSSNFKSSDGGKRPISTCGTTLAKSWQIKTDQGSSSYGHNQEVIIPQDVPPGLYILNLKAGRVNDQLILILSRHNLMLKQAERQIAAWVTDINGGAITDMQVQVYARDGKLISEGRTDENGVFRATVDRDPQPLIVLARKEDDITAAGLNNEWQTHSTQRWDWWWKPAPKAQDYAAHIYTDRPIYRPGQTVFFKGIIRNDDAVLSLPAAGKSVTVRIRDARNNVVRTWQLATNELGAVTDEFQLAEGAMLGEYAVEMVVDGESHRQIFKVQDYRKPDYQVSVKANAAQYIAGGTITVTVDSRYFFGEPVPDAQAIVKSYLLRSPYYWMDQPEENESEYTWYEAPSHSAINGRTDANGRFIFVLNAEMDPMSQRPSWMSSLRSTTWGIEATVDDGSHQTVSSFTTVQVFDAAEKIEMDVGGQLKTPGQPFIVRVNATAIADEPVSGRMLKLELCRYNSATNQYSTVVQTANLTTDADGNASLLLTVQEPGYYQLYLTGADRLGNAVSYESWLYVFSDAGQWEGRRGGDLSIAADQPSYAPGQTARLLIESTFSGPALLTFERGTTRRERLIQLTAPVTRVDVPIQPDDSPNIHVTVNAWREQSIARGQEYYENLPDSDLQTASVELRVPVTDKTLSVTITAKYPGTPASAPQSFAPRDKVAFTVRVTNARGEPVSAELSLALVDEAIFSLSNDLSGPILDAFYYRRANIVRTYDSMALVRWLGGGRGGGGGGGDGASIGNPRSDFPDTAAWFPVVRTDGNSEATVTVTLPDSLTSWRLTAKAVTANTEVGEKSILITTHQPIVVRPILPRTLTAGDQVELGALVHNYSGRPRNVAVSIQSPSLQIKSQITQSITLTPGEIRMVGWWTQAPSAGEATITVRADAGDMGDAVRLTIPIRPLAVPDVTSQIGEFGGELNTTIAWPKGAHDLSSVKIQLNRSIAGTLLDGLEYLTGYPYG